VQPGGASTSIPSTLDPSIAAGYLDKAKHGEGLVAYLLHLIPDTFFGAFSEGNLLQVLVIAVLTGFACTRLGDFGDKVGQRAGGRVQAVLRHHPRGGATGADRRVRGHGLHDRQVRHRRLVQLGALVATFYLTSILFVLVVLGTIAGRAASRSCGSWPISARSC
jgi:aerobic C4-dicarboxylate transport protein